LSWKFPFEFVEHLTQFFDFFLRAAPAGERVLHELAGGTVEDTPEHVLGQLPLGLFRGLIRRVDMRALLFGA
jgi:hypothetical protein